MTDETVLDRAHASMAAAPEDDGARLRFYETFADSEVFLLLTREAVGGDISPEVYPLETGRFVLVFDSEERLAAFAGTAVAYAALPGRVIAGALAGQGVGIGLNLGAGQSAFLMGSDAVDWLSGTLAHRPQEGLATLTAFHAPGALPEPLVAALRAKLGPLGRFAEAAHVVLATDADGRHGHLLAFEGAEPGAEEALAKAVSEAVVFSGIEAGEIAVAFLKAGDRRRAALASVALTIGMTAPAAAPEPVAPAAPGMDPTRPPILRNRRQ